MSTSLPWSELRCCSQISPLLSVSPGTRGGPGAGGRGRVASSCLRLFLWVLPKQCVSTGAGALVPVAALGSRVQFFLLLVSRVEAVWGWKRIAKHRAYQRGVSLLRTKSRDNVGTASAAGRPPDRQGRADHFLWLVDSFYSLKTKNIPVGRMALGGSLGQSRTRLKRLNMHAHRVL